MAPGDRSLDSFREALVACGVCGAVGVITGLAAAVLLDEESSGWFFAVLLLTAVLSYFFDWMKGVIDGREESSSPAQILFNYIVLVFFELLVASVHKLLGGGLAPLRQMGGGIVGRDLETHASALISVLAMAAAWTVIGASIGAALLGVIVWPSLWPRFMRSPGGYWASDRRRGMTVGALTGAILAPAAVMAGIFAARAAVEFTWMFRDPTGWREYLDSLAIKSNIPWWGMPSALLAGIAHLGGQHGPILTVLAAMVVFFGALVYVGSGSRSGGSAYIATVFILGLPFVFLWPIGATFVRDFRILSTMFGLVAIIWTAPCILLGWITPYLDRQSEHPRAWAWIAFAAGGCLLVLAVLDHMPRTLLLGGSAALLFILGRLFLNSSESRYYWPALAVSIAILIAGFTDFALRADLLSVENLSFSIVDQPVEVPAAPPQVFPKLPQFTQSYDDARLKALADLETLNADAQILKNAPAPSTLDLPPLAADDYLGRAIRDLAPTPEEVRKARQEKEQIDKQRREAQVQALMAPMLATREGYRKAIADLRGVRDGACEILLAYENELSKQKPTGQAACEAFAANQSQTADKIPAPVPLELLDTLAKRHDDLHDGAAAAAAASEALQHAAGRNDPEVRSLAMELSALETDTLSYDHFMTDRIEGQKRRLAGLFQVCVTGSVGFWLTLGLLASWSIWNRRSLPLTNALTPPGSPPDPPHGSRTA